MTENDCATGEARTFTKLVRAAAVQGDATALTLEGVNIPDEAISFTELDRQSAQIARGEVPMLPSNKVSRRAIATLLAERLLEQPGG